MYQVIIVIHVLLGLGVISLVLMQQGKGADAGAAFGTGSAGSVFGAQGAASFLSRSTAILATLFFFTSLGLAVVNGHKGTESDIMSTPATTESGLPAVEGEKNVTAMPPDAKETDTLPPTLPETPESNKAVESSKAVETPKTVETTKPVEANKPVETAKPTEPSKPVANNKPAEAEKKPVVKEHKQPAKKDNKKAADSHKGKDAKKDH
jgi:preprotein translocase subunit SecG